MQFIPQRLEEALALNMMTNSAFAEELCISPTAVGNWIKGKAIPRDGHINRMAEVLRVPCAFFFRAEKVVSLNGKLQFRASARRRKRETAMVESKLEYVTEATELLLGQFNLPTYEDIFGEFDPLSLEPGEIEIMAAQLREHWGLGTAPIKTLGNVLFNHGVILLRTDLPDSMDGFSFFHGGHPFIVLGNKGARSRDKLTTAHEFGHIILHHGRLSKPIGELKKEENEKVESDAFLFAGAFLLPAEAYLREVFSPSVDCLLSLKKKWQVSAAAQIRRLYQLGQIDSDRYEQLNKNLSWRGMKKREGNEEHIAEEPCDQVDLLSDRLKQQRPDLWDAFLDRVADLPDSAVSSWVSRKGTTSNIVEFKPGEFFALPE